MGGVVLRLRPLGAQPVDVDVAEPPGDGFFRAGRLRVSPMLDVPDYSEVPLAEREAVDRLVRWLASHESDITFVERTTWFSRFGASWLGPWLLVASLACAAIGISLDRRWATRREASAAGLVFGIALALRVSLGVWGPLRINGFGPIWISGAALDRSVLSAYGPGYAEVFGPLARLAPHAADTSIFGANAVLSALLAPLVYALARAFGVSTRPALLAAAVLAVDAASVRLAASESYFVVIATLVIAASIAIARSLHGFAVGARTSTLAWAFCGSFLCAQAARIHPCAWIPVACVPLATLGAEATGLRVRGRLLGLALAATLVGGVVLATSGKLIALALGEAIAWIPSTHGRELALGGVIGLALATLARPRRVALPAAVAVVGLLATRSAYAQSHDWQSGYDRLLACVPLLAACACIPDRWLRTSAGVASIAAALGALLAYAVVDLKRRTTDQLEYTWLRPYLDALPSECRVSWVDRAGPRVLALADYRPAREPGAPRPMRPVYSDADLPTGCVWYYHSSLCASSEGRPLCEAVERRLRLVPIAVATFPAVPSNRALPYDRTSVEVALSRVEGR